MCFKNEHDRRATFSLLHRKEEIVRVMALRFPARVCGKQRSGGTFGNATVFAACHVSHMA